LGARKQEKAKTGAGATGIEPETAIQRECSVTNTPWKPPFVAILISKLSVICLLQDEQH
jgi:hypothetical protein